MKAALWCIYYLNTYFLYFVLIILIDNEMYLLTYSYQMKHPFECSQFNYIQVLWSKGCNSWMFIDC